MNKKFYILALMFVSASSMAEVCDDECEAKKALTPEMAAQCVMKIESSMHYRYKWTDGMFKPKFILHKFVTGRTMLLAAGGQLEAENRSGAWQNQEYECYFRLPSGELIDYKVNGR